MRMPLTVRVIGHQKKVVGVVVQLVAINVMQMPSGLNPLAIFLKSHNVVDKLAGIQTVCRRLCVLQAALCGARLLLTRLDCVDGLRSHDDVLRVDALLAVRERRCIQVGQQRGPDGPHLTRLVAYIHANGGQGFR